MLSEGSTDVAEQQTTAAELLRTMFADIDTAQRRARALIASTRDPLVESYARQVLGIAHRERGEIQPALRELRRAMRLADGAHDVVRRADAQATLGGTLAVAGRTGEGLNNLDQAIAALDGRERAAALTRRGWIFVNLQGRYEEGASDLEMAATYFASVDDHVWHARARNLLGYARLGLGDLNAADIHFEKSALLSEELEHRYEHAYSVQNRGYVAFLRGDLPQTIALLRAADAEFEAAGEPNVDIVADRTTAYLAAGLLPEALEVVDSALERGRWVAREQAELQLVHARVLLASGNLTEAEKAAARAARTLQGQGREWFAAQADLVGLTARHARAKRFSAALRRDALALVEKSRRLRTPEHIEVLLLAAAIVGRHDPTAANELLREAEPARQHDAALIRALGWLARARRKVAAGQHSAAQRACEHGLSAIDEHQRLLGSSELRALASARGQDLAALALTSALQTDRPEQVLYWAERWRSTGTTTPVVVQRDEDTLRDLAVLRSQTQQANAARDAGQATQHFDRHIAALEHRIRERHLLRTGTAGVGANNRTNVPDLLAALGENDTTLVELFTLDGHLHAVVAHQGRVRLAHVGSLGKASQAQEYARFLLGRAARGRPDTLEQAGARLQAALLGDLTLPGDGPVIVSAPNQLQRLPWGLLPSLADRPVSSSPSAQAWLRALRQVPASDRRAFIVGPGLASGGAEVDAVRRHDPAATYLIGDHSTVQASLEHIDGAALVHIAAHGSFRKDNPLFSAIDLADGPLMVHDLEHLTRPPHRVVLSACETGDMQAVGADELLGLSVSLLAMGSAGVISSLVKVHDHATAFVMTHVHDALRRGEGGAAAMLHARETAGHDPLLRATAVSFTAFGT